MRQARRSSGGLRRQLAGDDAEADDSFYRFVRETGAHPLPNTAGCTTAREAVNLARMAREVLAQ